MQINVSPIIDNNEYQNKKRKKKDKTSIAFEKKQEKRMRESH